MAAAFAATVVVASGQLHHGPTAGASGVLILTFVAFLLTGVTLGRPSRWSAMLPLARCLVRLAHPVVAAGVLWGTTGVLGLGHVPLFTWGAAAAAANVMAEVLRRLWTAPMTRIAVVGSHQSAVQLSMDLAHAGIKPYALVGRIAVGKDRGSESCPSHRLLGDLSSVGAQIEEHMLDLLLIDGSASSGEVFDQLANSCLDLRIRAYGLTQFYEDALGHVPVTEIDSAWFRYIMHPRFKSPDTSSRRAFDLIVALVAAVVFLPAIAICAALIKIQDGGPILFAQRRIGSHGKAFTLLKLRTMHVASPVAEWSTAGDPRVTPIGRLLRRTHLDELPQLINILRGEMAVVGPRPEQPEFVERLELMLPHYARRHIVKPGITGWAQIRCGYAGSDSGSAWKLCNDLFYLKHRSLGLDLAILVETTRIIIANRQFPSRAAVGTGPAAAVTSVNGVAVPAD